MAATAYARSGDFRLNPEHPPLVRLWVGAAMPAALSEKAQERGRVERTMFQDNGAAEPLRNPRLE